MKKNIALVAGGYSGEYVISVQSAATIEQHIDKSPYQVYKISITLDGWFYSDKIGNRTPVDKNDFSLTLHNEKITFDAVFIGIHGAPGEDGKLQGYFDMLQIPYTGCGAVTSALTFNKGYCNKIVSTLNIVHVSKSIHIFRDQPFNSLEIGTSLKFPVFVKPAEGGSSLGISKVNVADGLDEAIERAFREDGQVLVEEYIKGRELTCGLFLSNGEPVTLPVTEVVSSKDFFDFEAKYTSGISREITPADIDDSVKELVQSTAKKLYCALNCRGIVRIDFILEENTGKLFFLEANTMPGQSENSLVPQQVKAAGMTLTTFYGILLEACLK